MDEPARTITSRTVADRNFCETLVTYTLTFDGDAYGLDVRTEEEQVCVEAFTSDRRRAEQLFETFTENIVFPCHVLEILDDLLAEGEI